MTDIEKMNLESKDLVAERIEQLKSLFPEISTEDSIDFDKLRLILGDEIETEQERYAFTWPGKAAAIRQSQTVSTAALRPRVDKSRGRDGKDGSFDSDNIYIEGDNLEVLKLLQRGYYGKIKMIYIDPPYNTGHDFVYKDKFGDTIANYKEQAGLAGQSNADTSGRYHSDWCSMMYPRLRLARELLTDDGVIFISIDDNESRNLRILCDEVFGEICFVGDIAWQKTYSPRNDSKGIPTVVEHIIVYSKQPGWIPQRLPRTAAMDAGYGAPDDDSKLWTSGDPSAPGAVTHQGMVYGIQHPFTGQIFYPPISSCWRIGQSELLEILCQWAPYELRDLHDEIKRAEVCGISPSDVRIGVQGIVLSISEDEAAALARKRYNKGSWPLMYFTANGMGGMRRKRYLDESRGRVVDNLWLHSEVGHTDEAKKGIKKLFDGLAPFDTPKPVRLLERILSIASTPDSIVLDFFSGSATMAEAVIRKNAEDDGSRNFILVQIPEKASGNWGTLCEVGEERIRRAGDKIKAEFEQESSQLKLDEEPKTLPDIGFRVFSLDDSGIEKPEPGQLMLDVVKPDRSELDIVFEMMLKWGLELTHPVEKTQAAGYPIWSVACDELICCMSPGLTSEAVEAIAAMEPRRVLILDSILSDTLKLNTIQTFKHASERMGYEIELRTV